LATVGPLKRADKALLAFALGYPEAHEDHPWGERVVKVKKKVFVFFHVPGRELHVTVKLPASGAVALGLPFVAPTGYGLGKSGWVTATFGPKDRPPVEVLMRWIDESYRAVAPKTLVVALPPAGSPPSPSRSPRRARAARKSSARREK
jgi:predicted DNA-binding protein (MmcQ/YjbR family)